VAFLLQQIIDGLAVGLAYGSLALAIVLILRSTGIVNFAQGQMAMFSTYIAWQLWALGLSIWLAILIALLASFIGGAAIESALIRPLAKSDPLTVMMVTLGLFLILQNLAGWIWTFLVKDFPSPYPKGVISVGDIRITWHSLGTLGVIGVLLFGLNFLFKHTKLGLSMRGAAENPESARLCGISVTRMRMLGWGIAAVLGAISGVTVASRFFLEPTVMLGVLIYALAAATLGGFDSPLGAVVGGLTLGVLENLVGTYVPWIGSDLRMLVAVLVIFAVLLYRPAGMFGSRRVARV
jgi:branched-chain amino acid transport system permease protein